MQSIKELKIRLYQSRFFKDSFWALTGNVLNKGLALLAGVVIARFLGKEAYGEYGMIKNTLLYIAVFSTFGLGFTATKVVAQTKDNIYRLCVIYRASTIISLSFSGGMAIFVFVFSHQLASYLEVPDISTILKYTAITIVLNSLVTVQIGVMAGLKKFKDIAKVNFVVGLLTFVFSITLTYYYSLEGAVFALLITNFLNCLFNQSVIQKAKLTSLKTSMAELKKEVKSLIRFSTPIAIQESTYSVTYWLSILLLVKLSDYGELGLYSAAIQWSGAILFIPSVLQNVILSYLSESTGSGDHRRLLKRMLAINLVITFIPFVFVLAFSNLIVSFYGAGYEGLWSVLIVSVATTVVRCLVQVYVQEYIAIGKTWMLCLIRLVRDIVSLGVAAVLILQLRERAAYLYSCSVFVAQTICCIILAVYHRKKIYESRKICQ